MGEIWCEFGDKLRLNVNTGGETTVAYVTGQFSWDSSIQGVPKVIVQRFGLIARPVIIWSAKFLQECSRKVAHSRNSMVLAKSMFIFLNERSFFTFFAPLTCLDHIPFELLLFGPTRYEISEKIRALAYPLFEISTVKVYVHDVGLCTASTISQARQPHLTG